MTDIAKPRFPRRNGPKRSAVTLGGSFHELLPLNPEQMISRFTLPECKSDWRRGRCDPLCHAKVNSSDKFTPPVRPRSYVWRKLSPKFTLEKRLIGYARFPPRADPRRRHQASDFIRYRRKNSKLSVVSSIVAKMMPSAVPGSSRRVGLRES
jgi:hypothetical protein